MGKVLSNFTNGYPGAVSRSVDNVIISIKNATGGSIPFGVPVFLVSGENACRTFDAETCTPENFLGITVRAVDKTPDAYGSNQASYGAGDPVEVLVRGSTVLYFEYAANVGASVYVRKADGKIVTSAGSEGTTVKLPGVTVRALRDSTRHAEIVLTERNII